MYTLLVAYEVTAEKAAVAVPLKDYSARLTGYAVVIALPAEVLTRAHMRS